MGKRKILVDFAKLKKTGNLTKEEEAFLERFKEKSKYSRLGAKIAARQRREAGLDDTLSDDYKYDNITENPTDNIVNREGSMLLDSNDVQVPESVIADEVRRLELGVDTRRRGSAKELAFIDSHDFKNRGTASNIGREGEVPYVKGWTKKIPKPKGKQGGPLILGGKWNKFITETAEEIGITPLGLTKRLVGQRVGSNITMRHLNMFKRIYGDKSHGSHNMLFGQSRGLNAPDPFKGIGDYGVKKAGENNSFFPFLRKEKKIVKGPNWGKGDAVDQRTVSMYQREIPEVLKDISSKGFPSATNNPLEFELIVKRLERDPETALQFERAVKEWSNRKTNIHFDEWLSIKMNIPFRK